MNFCVQRAAPLLLAAFLFLGGCQRSAAPPATPAPARVTATPSALAERARPASVTAPTATAPAPTATAPAPSPAPTAETATATTAPLSPAPTRRPVGPLTLSEAIARQKVGDYDAAASAYRALLAGSLSAEETKDVRFRLAQTEMLGGNLLQAGADLTKFVQDYPDDVRAAAASFMLGRLLFGAQQWDAAANAYANYVRLGGPLADYAQNRVGNAYFAAKKYDQAAQAYEAAATRSDATQPVLRAAWNGLGDTRLAQGNIEGARAAYEAAFQAADDDEDRGAAVYALAQLYAKTGDVAAEKAQLGRLWNDFGKTQAAYAAAQADPHSDDVALLYGKGMAAYNHGDNRLAVTLFNRLADEDPKHPAGLHLYAGGAYRRLGQPTQAIFHYDQLIDTHPGDPLIPDALLGKARALRSGDAKAAEVVYADLVARFPDHADAADAALERAELVEQDEGCAAAVGAYRAVADRVPAPASLDARRRLALCQAQTGDTAGAAATWQTLTMSSQPDRQAEGLYWQAKLSGGDKERAASLYRQAMLTAPASIYGARAAQALGEWPMLALDERSEAAAEAWLLENTGHSAEDMVAARQAVENDPDVAHARALFEQGLRDVALKHLRLARDRARHDPLRLYQVARVASAMGGEAAGTSAADLLVADLGTSPASLPFEILAQVYPRPYSDLVAQAASEQGVDANLLYAIMRQESRFEPSVVSAAGARGLAQVMPTTGESVARAMGMTDFDAADLFKPSVNVPIGAAFLSQQLKRFDGEVWAAVAAYNAGPNAVPRWQKASSDPDAQIEAVDYPETRTYLQRVLGAWAMYHMLYSQR
ncbi:MAG: transglycosylase SLT domain-containing protein [Anaerolineae bacterium]